MTTFTLSRLQNGKTATAGELRSPDGDHLCATLERAWNDNRSNSSRIPAGTYLLALKPYDAIHPLSHFDQFYRNKFKDFHQGMIEITGVPSRSGILFHMGNWPFQTEGCVICGERTVPQGASFMVPPGESAPGYIVAYGALLKAVRCGGAAVRIADPGTPYA